MPLPAQLVKSVAAMHMEEIVFDENLRTNVSTDLGFLMVWKNSALSEARSLAIHIPVFSCSSFQMSNSKPVTFQDVRNAWLAIPGKNGFYFIFLFFFFFFLSSLPLFPGFPVVELDVAGWLQLWWGKATIPQNHTAAWLLFSRIY